MGTSYENESLDYGDEDKAWEARKFDLDELAEATIAGFDAMELNYFIEALVKIELGRRDEKRNPIVNPITRGICNIKAEGV